MATKISAVIITFNEERVIERCLQSLKGVVDEIIVVDSFSTDSTASICRRYDARFTPNAWAGYGPQKNIGIRLASFPYILSIDADEELDASLRQSIIRLKEDDLQDVYSFSRLNNYYGRFLKHGLEYPDVKPRLFPKNDVRWNDDAVHEKLIFDQPKKTVNLNGYLLHYTYSSVHDQLQKMNNYTTLGAQLYWKKGKRPSWFTILLSPFYTFIRAYFIKLGILDGKEGFIVAVLNAYSNFIKRIKLWDLARIENEKQTSFRSADPIN